MGEENDKMTAHFDRMAAGYEKIFVNNFPMFERLRDLVGAALGSTEKVVLDLGSGPGEPGISIAKAFPHVRVIVTDSAPAMVEKAKARSAGCSNVDTALLSADDLAAYPDNSVDAITLCYVLMYVPDKAKVISEMARVLKPGGVAYVTVWKELNISGPKGIVSEAMVKFCSTNSFTPPSLHTPLSCSADGFVEALVEATPGVDVDHTERFTSYFNLGADNDAFTMFAVNNGLREYEDQGHPGAVSEFVDALRQVCEARGYTSQDITIIPDNVAQILTMRKQNS